MRVPLRVAFADTAADMLAFALPPHPRPSLAVLPVPLDGGTLELHVLGASHQVVAELGGRRLVEVVACDAGGEQLLRTPQVDRVVNGLRHRFQASVQRLEPEELAAATHRIEADLAEDPAALVAVFPGTGGLTALQQRHVVGGVGWTTTHTYPQTGEMVTTSTEVTPA